MSESELENPFLLRAFRSAESCNAEAECTLDALDEAMIDLQDDPTWILRNPADLRCDILGS